MNTNSSVSNNQNKITERERNLNKHEKITRKINMSNFYSNILICKYIDNYKNFMFEKGKITMITNIFCNMLDNKEKLGLKEASKK